MNEYKNFLPAIPMTLISKLNFFILFPLDDLPQRTREFSQGENEIFPC